MSNAESRQRQYADRFVAVAQEHGTRQHDEKNLIMASMIGYLAGLLGKYAALDIGIQQELKALEQGLDINQKSK
jgi:hypothetical protein